MKAPEPPILDASPAYRLWDDLFSAGLKLALSTSGAGAEEERTARERLARATRHALRERDAMWERILRSLK